MGEADMVDLKLLNNTTFYNDSFICGSVTW
jgi:hypothetical protein